MTAYADAIAKPPRTLTDFEQKLILKTTGEHRDVVVEGHAVARVGQRGGLGDDAS